MDLFRIRKTFKAETGKYPIIKVLPNNPHNSGQLRLSFNKRELKYRSGYDGGFQSLKYIIWIEDKIEDIFGIWRDKIYKMYKNEKGIPVFKTSAFIGKSMIDSHDYFDWLENKFLDLINEKQLEYI